MTIGERIKKRRIELGLSVTQLAERLGKDRTTVYRYESSFIENMPINILAPLAKALQTTPAFLMGWESDNYDFQTKENEENNFAKDAIKNSTENMIISKIKLLNSQGQLRTLEYINDLLSSGNYSVDADDTCAALNPDRNTAL